MDRWKIAEMCLYKDKEEQDQSHIWKIWALRKWVAFLPSLFSENEENMVAAAGWFINLVMERIPLDSFGCLSEIWGKVIILKGRGEEETSVSYEERKIMVMKWTSKFSR